MSRSQWKLHENGDGSWCLLEVHKNGGHVVAERVSTEHLERALNILRSLRDAEEATRLIKDIEEAQS